MPETMVPFATIDPATLRIAFSGRRPRTDTRPTQLNSASPPLRVGVEVAQEDEQPHVVKMASGCICLASHLVNSTVCVVCLDGLDENACWGCCSSSSSSALLL